MTVSGTTSMPRSRARSRGISAVLSTTICTATPSCFLTPKSAYASLPCYSFSRDDEVVIRLPPMDNLDLLRREPLFDLLGHLVCRCRADALAGIQRHNFKVGDVHAGEGVAHNRLPVG